jgi:ketosteroid isomerase-like protein
MGDPPVGRDALRAFVANMPDLGTHHMLTNLIIDVDGDTATCDASALVTAKGSIMITAHTHDDLRRVDGSWQIVRRTYEPDATE